MFRRAGVKPPPTSWNDPSWTFSGRFLEVARALTLDKNNRHPGEKGFDSGNIVQFGVGHFFRETIYWAWGGQYYNAAARRVAFNTADSINGIQFAGDLINRYHVKPSARQVAALGAGAQAGSEEQFAWRAGKLAMIDMCSCDIRSPLGTSVPFTWRPAAVPSGPVRRFNFLNLDVGTILRASHHHDLAWEVLKYLAINPNVERQLSFGAYGEFPPLRSTVGAFPAGIHRELPAVDARVWQNGFPHAYDYNEAWFPAFAAINDLIGPTFDKVEAGAPAAPLMRQLQGQAQSKVNAWLHSHPNHRSLE